MEDLLIVIWRTVFLYVLIIVVLRIMGKRELGELSVVDLVISVLMAEVAAFALDDPDSPLFMAIMPILVLLIIQITASFISLKSKKFRDVVEGGPAVIIRNGVIEEQTIRRQRYNIDNLLQQLREQQVASVRNVAYAFLEASGNLAVFEKDSDRPILPLISDGVIQKEHLPLIGKDMEWLMNELNAAGYSSPEQVFFCTLDKEGMHIQEKGRTG